MAFTLCGLSCAPERPSSAPAPRLAAFLSPEEHDGGRRIGRSWLRSAGPGAGILVGRFEGEPYALGAAFGRLTAPYTAAQEYQLEAFFRALIPNGLVRGGLQQIISFRLRNVVHEIPSELLLTLAGVADGYEPEPPPDGWSAYRRLIDLHALHEVSQSFVKAPYLESYCTGFLASGRATHGGNTLLARNFDFEGGAIFDRDKVVAVVAPEGKIPYLSVGLPGMVGVVSGFNREGIGVAVQSIAGGETAKSGEPMTLLMADVLRNERTLEGVIERVRRARVFVSDMILVGEGATGRIAVLEKTPSAFSVREAGARGWIGVTNEAETDAGRMGGLAIPAGGTARKRQDRLLSVLKESAGSLDVAGAVAILRDHRSASGVDLGTGNRNAINALITTHSVVFDLTARRAWVSCSPHTLGAYLPVDLEAVLAGGRVLSTEAPLPADPFLLSGGFDRYRRARRALASVRRLEAAKEDGWLFDARRELEAAHDLAPDFVEVTARLGEVVARLGDRERARALLDDALLHDPGPETFAKGIVRLRSAVAGGDVLPPPGVLASFPEPDELIEETGAKDVPSSQTRLDL